MRGDGMEAMHLERVNDDELDHTPRLGCLVAGCGCTDRRIVSPRRAGFHAYLARTRGETADRCIAPETEWRLPA